MTEAVSLSFRWLLAALLLLAAVLASGCDRSEGARLVGAWEGTPAKGAIGVEQQGPSIESVRFEFEESGRASITLRVIGEPDRTAQATWYVLDSGLERITVLLSLPADDSEEARSSELMLEFEGPDRMVASEVDGDYRVPAMILVREGSQAAAEQAKAEEAGAAGSEAAPAPAAE